MLSNSDMRLFSDEYLTHHGILGQKWGVRRFQNKDGSFTTAGRARKNEKFNLAEFNAKYEAKQKRSYPEMQRYFAKNKSAIANEAGRKLANWTFKWRDEYRNSETPDGQELASHYDKIIRGRSKSQMSSDFAKQIDKNIGASLNGKGGRDRLAKIGNEYSISIDGIPDYNNGNPLQLSIDPTKSKTRVTIYGA